MTPNEKSQLKLHLLNLAQGSVPNPIGKEQLEIRKQTISTYKAYLKLFPELKG